MRSTPNGTSAAGAAAPTRAADVTPHVVTTHAVYTIPAATAALGLARECLPREIRLGRLEARKRAGRYFILGSWLLRWLETGTPHRRWKREKGTDEG